MARDKQRSIDFLRNQGFTVNTQKRVIKVDRILEMRESEAALYLYQHHKYDIDTSPREATSPHD